MSCSSRDTWFVSSVSFLSFQTLLTPSVCSALELQSRAIVPGSIRIVYAIIYSLFLGFGITVGAALYASSTQRHFGYHLPESNPRLLDLRRRPHLRRMHCHPLPGKVAPDASHGRRRICRIHGQLLQRLRFAAAPQIANTLGALTVGVLANLYSRIRHGVAAATLIPAIFTQVPGGLASTGGLLSGLSTANMLTNSTRRSMAPAA